MNEYYFITNSKGDELYAKDFVGNEFYPSGKNVFAKNADGTFRYARKLNRDEFYPLINGFPDFKPISETNSQYEYAKNRYGDEFYLQYPGSKVETWIETNGILKYAKTSKGDEILPKLHTGEEIELLEIPARHRLGHKIYPHRADGSPVYSTDPSSGDEIYTLTKAVGKRVSYVFGMHLKTELEVYAKTSNGDEIYPITLQFAYNSKEKKYMYAKKANEDEYYPGENVFAYDFNNHTYLYAKKKSGEIIFPLDEDGHEMYVFDPDTGYDVITLETGEFIPRYARMNDGYFIREIYPTYILDGEGIGEFQVVLNSLGYRMFDGKRHYPKDEYSNEYVIFMPGNSDLYPYGYPDTWDRYPIVKGDDITGKPILNPKDASVTEDKLTHNIWRLFNGFRDFVSSEKVENRAPRQGHAYLRQKVTKTLNKNNRSWLIIGWLVLFVIFLGVIFKIIL